VFWLSRPPYLRWGLAATLVAVGLWTELAPEPGTLHPFARDTLPAGALITEDLVEMRVVPEGLFDPVHLPARTRVPVPAGRPLISHGLERDRPTPDGWWTFALPVPPGGTAGSPVRLVVDDGASAATFDGILVSSSPGDYGGTEGVVAVPEDAVVSVGRTGSEVTVFLGG
jgi:hypothetical protein